VPLSRRAGADSTRMQFHGDPAELTPFIAAAIAAYDLHAVVATFAPYTVRPYRAGAAPIEPGSRVIVSLQPIDISVPRQLACKTITVWPLTAHCALNPQDGAGAENVRFSTLNVSRKAFTEDLRMFR
jgi:hypothetical protein